MFRFLVEEKLKCLATEKVKYTQRVDYIMQLPVPMDAALNKGQSCATARAVANVMFGCSTSLTELLK